MSETIIESLRQLEKEKDIRIFIPEIRKMQARYYNPIQSVRSNAPEVGNRLKFAP